MIMLAIYVCMYVYRIENANGKVDALGVAKGKKSVGNGSGRTCEKTSQYA